MGEGDVMLKAFEERASDKESFESYDPVSFRFAMMKSHTDGGSDEILSEDDIDLDDFKMEKLNFAKDSCIPIMLLSKKERKLF